MDDHISVAVGFDQREAVAYHTFCQSIIDKSTVPVRFVPLAENLLSGYRETHTDGSNKFIYSRFLTPFLHNFRGWAIFFDGDMICRSDINELWKLRDETKAVQVVKHDYKTKAKIKYLGNRNEDYPRKNWSSVILWNCSHPRHAILTPQFIQGQPGSFLHRFSWLANEDIGALPIEWNWLAIEYPDNPGAKLVHYTLGAPCFKDYNTTSMSADWKESFLRSQEGLDK